MSKISGFWTDSVAYVALILGAGVSVAGNIADTFRTRGVATDGLDIFLASFWPAVVVLTVHLFVSARWPARWTMQIFRWLGCVSIGAMAMRVSWVHLNDLMLSRGQEVDVAILGPLAIDFLAIMATALILAGRGQIKVPHTPDGWVATPLANALDTFATGQREPATPLANSYMVSPIMTAEDSETDLFARLERQFAPEVPVVPVPVSPALPTVPQVRDAINGELARKGRLSLENSTEAQKLAEIGRENGLSAGDISELLAGHYGVSSRTIRRCGWWVPTMAGKLETDAS